MTSDPDLFRKPDAYEKFMGRYSHPLAHEFAHAAAVGPSERVLDVGCGTGALAAVLAAIVGEEHVAGVDPSEPFVEQTRESLPGADVRVGPAEALPFGDDEFDRALAQLIFHFVDDPAAAVAEMTRVTRPGGLVAACVWDFTGGMRMMRGFWDAARATDPAAPDEAERFGGGPGQLARLWRESGLRDVVDSSLTVSTRYHDFDELWDSFLGGVGPVGVYAASLDGEMREAVRHAFRRNIGSPVGAFDLAAVAWCATGIV